MRVKNETSRTIRSAGYVFAPDEVLELSDITEAKEEELRRCRRLKVLDEAIDVKPNDNSFMEPPRHICGCGFVAKSAAGLKVHQRACREVRLNLGCGTDVREGYTNIDIRELPDVTVADVSMLNYSEVEYILANDIIEHFDRKQGLEVLKSWVGMLRGGGVLELRCPDVVHARKVMSEDTFIEMLYGLQDYPENYHKAGFTLKTMTALLEELGMNIDEAKNTPDGNLWIKAVK